MTHEIKKVTLATAFILSVFSCVTFADDDDAKKIETLSKTFGLITLEEATKKALAVKPGVVKEAELEDRKFSKGWDYEFEIVDADSREWEVNIDAKTGEVRNVSREWF